MDKKLEYKDLKGEFRLTSSGDVWGDTMQWWFSIADELYWNREEGVVPASWEFKPAPMGPQNDPEDYITVVVKSATTEDLVKFGEVLSRYSHFLKLVGKDY